MAAATRQPLWPHRSDWQSGRLAGSTRPAICYLARKHSLSVRVVQQCQQPDAKDLGKSVEP